jgi:hypothetical protein
VLVLTPGRSKRRPYKGAAGQSMANGAVVLVLTPGRSKRRPYKGTDSLAGIGDEREFVGRVTWEFEWAEEVEWAIAGCGAVC